MNSNTYSIIFSFLILTISNTLILKNAVSADFTGKRWFWQVNGEAYSGVSHQGTLYVGGRFDKLTPDNPNFGIINLETKRSINYTPQVQGVVNDAYSFQDGSWIIAGEITSVDGAVVFNIARFNQGGTIDRGFLPKVDQPIKAITVDEDNEIIYVAGYFGHINEEPRQGIAALDLISGDILPFTIANDEQNEYFFDKMWLSKNKSLLFLLSGNVLFQLNLKDSNLTLLTPELDYFAMFNGESFFWISSSWVDEDIKFEINIVDPKSSSKATKINLPSNEGQRYRLIGFNKEENSIYLTEFKPSHDSYEIDLIEMNIDSKKIEQYGFSISDYFSGIESFFLNENEKIAYATGRPSFSDRDRVDIIKIDFVNKIIEPLQTHLDDFPEYKWNNHGWYSTGIHHIFPSYNYSNILLTGNFYSIGGYASDFLIAFDELNEIPLNPDWLHEESEITYQLGFTPKNELKINAKKIINLETGQSRTLDTSDVYRGVWLEQSASSSRGIDYIPFKDPHVNGIGTIYSVDSSTNELIDWETISLENRNDFIENPFSPSEVKLTALFLSADEKTIFLSGVFTHINDKVKIGLAAIDASTGDILDWAPDINFDKFTNNSDYPSLTLHKSLDNDFLYISGQGWSINSNNKEFDNLVRLEINTKSVVQRYSGYDYTSYPIAEGALNNTLYTYNGAYDITSGKPLSWLYSWPEIPLTFLSSRNDIILGSIWDSNRYQFERLKPNLTIKPSIYPISQSSIDVDMHMDAKAKRIYCPETRNRCQATLIPDLIGVELSCSNKSSTECATIYYTIDGSDPTEFSSAYLNPILVNSRSILKYAAVDSAGNLEPYHRKFIIVDKGIPKIEVTPPPGEYDYPLEIKINCDDGVEAGCKSIKWITEPPSPRDSNDFYYGNIWTKIISSGEYKFYATDYYGRDTEIITLKYKPKTSSDNWYSSISAFTLLAMALFLGYRFSVNVSFKVVNRIVGKKVLRIAQY